MNIHSINPPELIEYVYYNADCSLFPTDVGFAMTREISVTNENLKIFSKAGQKIPPITIQLLKIISVESFIARHPGKFVGGCPSCKITFRTKSEVNDSVTIFTADIKFEAGSMIKLGAQSAMLRLERLVQNNVPFSLCPFLLKPDTKMSTRTFIDQLVLHLPQMRYNISFKRRLWLWRY
jgi:hypothetical protein